MAESAITQRGLTTWPRQPSAGGTPRSPFRSISVMNPSSSTLYLYGGRFSVRASFYQLLFSFHTSHPDSVLYVFFLYICGFPLHPHLLPPTHPLLLFFSSHLYHLISQSPAAHLLNASFPSSLLLMTRREKAGCS